MEVSNGGLFGLLCQGLLSCELEYTVNSIWWNITTLLNHYIMTQTDVAGWASTPVDPCRRYGRTVFVNGWVHVYKTRQWVYRSHFHTAKTQYGKFETNIPRKGNAQSQSQITTSQTHECGNWDWSRKDEMYTINETYSKTGGLRIQNRIE